MFIKNSHCEGFSPWQSQPIKKGKIPRCLQRKCPQGRIYPLRLIPRPSIARIKCPAYTLVFAPGKIIISLLILISNEINQSELCESSGIVLTLFLNEFRDIRDYLVVAGVVEYLVTVALI